MATPVIGLKTPDSQRIKSIDALRGLVMLLMLLDHVRERFFLHRQVSDPMDVESTEPALFASRLAAHFCAPIFVFLTGLSAWLYQQSARAESVSIFLLKRGLLLIVLEFTLVTFSWMGNFNTIYLQVIWVIGLSMLALALLVKMPRVAQWLLAVGIIALHNLLTPIQFSVDEWGYSLWTILHDRNYWIKTDWLAIKVSYPLLPWIGVILLGYCAGPLFAKQMFAARRTARLVGAGIGSLLLLLLLRGFNLYGETLPWQTFASPVQTLMSFFNFTKYPPSLDFLLLTLGVMALVLVWLERFNAARFVSVLSQFGAAPLFFYLLHLYVLLFIYTVFFAFYGANKGIYFGVDSIYSIWLISLLLALLLYWPTAMFAEYKCRSTYRWIKYL
ncbi:hypothetical protein CBP51_06410 [Cellvibrio mixtus]|uniref:Heparan-alpha-glucosaminide N-acetyltransferase catalytic domain-containing protein n=1 Tax=Cellvibrio mixtus TaxID=39650 RepID=A0A266QAJ2_9GAMM|nr:heparan-alpha-glucosaminide N-acetyltransferase domain-containing protein [Cellvibrio mixtus]OZY86646.1 hypothetical protein CBP51_06410 [Cellvibrio mixtus]